MTTTPPSAAVPAQPDALRDQFELAYATAWAASRRGPETPLELAAEVKTYRAGDTYPDDLPRLRDGWEGFQWCAALTSQGAAERAVPAEFLRGVIALCTQKGFSPENIEAWDKGDKWIADLWRDAETMLAAAPATPAPHGQAPAGAVQEREMEEALRERDDAEDFIDTLLDEVLGADRAEWSNTYGRPEALEEVRERMTALHKPAVDRAWARFETATQQVGASVTVSVGSQEFDLAETGAHFTTADMATACGQAFREGQATPTAQATPAAPSQQESNMAAPAQDERGPTYLCQAWGETDLPAAAIVHGLDDVRAFLIEQWLGDADAMDGAGEKTLPRVMAEMQEDWDREGQSWEWRAEFEIGGISVQRVDDVGAARAAAPVAPAPAALSGISEIYRALYGASTFVGCLSEARPYFKGRPGDWLCINYNSFKEVMDARLALRRLAELAEAAPQPATADALDAKTAAKLEMADEYQRWIDHFHKGGSYDDFLRTELAAQRGGAA